MNYYLIWTEKGWLRTPTYNHAMCSCILEPYENINVINDIHFAYRLDEYQARECLVFLQRYGVASWTVEVKEDMLQSVLDEMYAKKCEAEKRKEKNNG